MKQGKKKADTKMCPICHKLHNLKGDFCSRKCKSVYAWKDVEVKYCKYCNKKLDFRMFDTVSSYKKAMFCDRKCRTAYQRNGAHLIRKSDNWYSIKNVDIHITKVDIGNSKVDIWKWRAYKDNQPILSSVITFDSFEQAIHDVYEVFS